MVIAFTAQAFWYGIEEIYISIQFEMQTDDKQMYQGAISELQLETSLNATPIPYSPEHGIEITYPLLDFD
jgi:hypothetical protein